MGIIFLPNKVRRNKTHPATAQNTAYALPPHNANASVHTMVLPPFLNCHTFCVGCCQRYTAHCFFVYSIYFFSGKTKKAKSCCQPSTAQTKSRYIPTTTTISLMPVLKMSEATLT
ncbi:hypothetical protein [Flavobacterium aurantiibacter]|uniref:hypothetical protein n=1 Tax=Flavobacterium aurantiibacter TaxID=2023067 RepID=UPI0010563B19|nr:hypothetical protein [Flavobacterium aurantiibacter]